MDAVIETTLGSGRPNYSHFDSKPSLKFSNGKHQVAKIINVSKSQLDKNEFALSTVQFCNQNNPEFIISRNRLQVFTIIICKM